MPNAFALWPQSPLPPNRQMAQCSEKPKRSIKDDLWVPEADPGMVRVSDLAEEGGGGSGEGGFSTMRRRLSASVSSTCTSGCFSVAGTWREGEDSQGGGEPGTKGLAVFLHKGTESTLGGVLGSLTSQWGPQEHSTSGSKNAEPRGLCGARPPQTSAQQLPEKPGHHSGHGSSGAPPGAQLSKSQTGLPGPRGASLGFGGEVGGWHPERAGGGRESPGPSAWPSTTSAASSLQASASPSQGRGDKGTRPHTLEGPQTETSGSF